MLSVMLAAGGAVVALLALTLAAASRRRLSILSESYWELRYEFAQLRARVAKLDGGPAPAAGDEAPQGRSGE